MQAIGLHWFTKSAPLWKSWFKDIVFQINLTVVELTIYIYSYNDAMFKILQKQNTFIVRHCPDLC